MKNNSTASRSNLETVFGVFDSVEKTIKLMEEQLEMYRKYKLGLRQQLFPKLFRTCGERYEHIRVYTNDDENLFCVENYATKTYVITDNEQDAKDQLLKDATNR